MGCRGPSRPCPVNCRPIDTLSDGLVRRVLLSRWSLTGRESDIVHTGASWITWLLNARSERYRIFHDTEAQVYLEEGCRPAAHMTPVWHSQAWKTRGYDTDESHTAAGP
jgi:hypothetical protein